MNAHLPLGVGVDGRSHRRLGNLRRPVHHIVHPLPVVDGIAIFSLLFRIIQSVVRPTVQLREGLSMIRGDGNADAAGYLSLHIAAAPQLPDGGDDLFRLLPHRSREGMARIKTRNSSPPIRPTTSICRNRLRISLAVSTRKASPNMCPLESFTSLKSSISMIKSADTSPFAGSSSRISFSEVPLLYSLVRVSAGPAPAIFGTALFRSISMMTPQPSPERPSHPFAR